jgi:transcriptional regulator with XRE-family HTH domain
MVHLGENIARLRGLRRITQKQMAGKLKLAQSVYSKVEKREEIDDQLLEQIAAALEVTPEAIKNFNENAVTNIISCNFHDNAVNAVYNFNPMDKLFQVVTENKDLYERLLKEKDEKLQLKDEVIALYKLQLKIT